MNKFFLLIAALFFSTDIFAQKNTLLIGTYTNTGKSEGIYVYEFDSKTGSLTLKNKATGVADPSYLCVSPDVKHVYAVNESGKGFISSFLFNKETGKLDFKNKIESGGTDPCYISTDQTGRLLFTSNYTGGSLSVSKVNADGTIKRVQVIQHKGSSVNKERQEAAHVHSTVLSPDKKYVFVSDLGMDQITSYKINGDALSLFKTIKVPGGFGPRHLTFSSNGRFAYLVTEMSGDVIAYRYTNGNLKWLQTIPMEAKDFKGGSAGSAIHISPDGKFLYASNREDANRIAIYAINAQTGKLTLKGRQSSMGKAPRDFTLDPTGNFLIAANQDTNDIYVFKRDKVTGLLKYNGNKLELGQPVCLVFVK